MGPVRVTLKSELPFALSDRSMVLMTGPAPPGKLTMLLANVPQAGLAMRPTIALTGGTTGTLGYTAADAAPLNPTSAVIAMTLERSGRRKDLKSMEYPPS